MTMNMTGWPVPTPPALDPSVFPKYILNIVLDQMAGSTPKVMQTRAGHGLFVNLVRLCDKAANEYDAARTACQDFADNLGTGRISPYFRASDHFENSINALHRALLHADKIRSARDLPDVDRTVWRSLRDATIRLNDIRDAIEHTEARLCDGAAPEGQPYFLRLEADHLTLDGVVITFAELARWIRQVHDVMRAVQRPPV